ncbi:hypothetical protein MRX96_020295 [Rhipicephalus microplus]
MARGTQGGHHPSLLFGTTSRRAVRTMVQEENHPQLTGPPASTAMRTYAQAAFSALRQVPTPACKQASARSVPPSTEYNASPVTPAAAFSAEAIPRLRDDPRDDIIASLQLTLRSVGERLYRTVN